MRRFTALNTIAALSSLVWAAGVVIILAGGGNVIAVVACQLAVAVLKSAVMLWLAARHNPMFRFRPFFLRWSALRHHVSFALASQLENLLGSVSWNLAPILLGFIRGPASAVPFYIGQKLPMAVYANLWRAADVLFPAVSENQHNIEKSGELLRVGSRLILVFILPLIIVLFVGAPGILQAWLGNPPQGAATVLRILAATVLADAVLAIPLYLLWGRGAMRPILLVSTVQCLDVVVLTAGLVWFFGVSGAAWGMLIPTGAAAAILFAVASRECKLDAWKLAASTWRGLLLPAISCAVSGSVLIHFWHNSRLSAIVASAVGVVLYAAILFGFSGSDEERRIARTALYRSRNNTFNIYHRIRESFVRRRKY